MKPNQQPAKGTPLTHTKPTERRDRANSHFCKAVGSTVYCLKQECKYCDTEEEKNVEDEK